MFTKIFILQHKCVIIINHDSVSGTLYDIFIVKKQYIKDDIYIYIYIYIYMFQEIIIIITPELVS